MTDEMILVPRAELLAWAKAWKNAYDPNDGTDCVTPFDLYLMKAPVEAPSAPYDRKRIAWELERTAMGDGYYGNALYVAKEFPEATPALRSLLDRWATGKEWGLSDRTDLCAFALQIYAAERTGETE